MDQPLQEALALHQQGRLTEARDRYGDILRRCPNHPNALHLIGVLLAEAGDPRQGVDLIRRATELQPDYVQALVDLGTLLADEGDAAAAVAAFQTAARQRPRDGSLQCALGVARRMAGDDDGAVDAFHRAIVLGPTSVDARLELGSVFRSRGRLDAAVGVHSAAVALRPDSADAHDALGQTLAAAGQLDAAAAEFTAASRLDPTRPEFHTRLAAALARLGRPAEACAALDAALALDGDDADGHQVRGELRLAMSHAGPAEASFRRSLDLRPGSARGWIGLGFALRSAGRFGGAAAAFRRALAIEPDNLIVYNHIASTGSATESETAALERAADRPGLSPGERAAAGFALGKLLDGAGHYDRAFDHYARANAIVDEACDREGRRFDPRALRAAVSSRMETFTPALFAAAAEVGNASELPVFVVGMPRSGTSLVEQILASHSMAVGAGELTDVDAIARSVRITNPADATGQRAAVAAAADSYLRTLTRVGPQACRVVDKLPANLFNLGLVACLFPNARVVFCDRDARDTCLSCYFEWFDGNGLPFSYSQVGCATQFLEQARLAAHWRRVLPLRWTTIQYERLVDGLEEQSRRLIDFVGLPWEPACLNFHETERTVRTASVWQVRQPVYASSVGRWRHYASHLGPLLATLTGDHVASPS